MRLPEYISKDLFKNAGIEIPKGVVIKKKDFDPMNFDWESLPVPGIVKAQNALGGRGKAGGIRKGSTSNEIKKHVEDLFRDGYGDNIVDVLLVEELLDISKENYLSISLDRRNRCFSIIGSDKGGMDVEGLSSDDISSVLVSPILGCRPYHVSYIAKKVAGCDSKDNQLEAKKVIENLYSVFSKEKAHLVEINPLVLLSDGRFIAADAKVILDDNNLESCAPFIKELNNSTPSNNEDVLYSSAKKLGVNMVVLDGEIAVISNGAGEGMATIDQIVHNGGSVGVWTDLGGGALSAKPETFSDFLNAVMDRNPKVLLFTAFFQIGKCDLFAESILNVCKKRGDHPPVILRLEGNRIDEARKIVENTEFSLISSSLEACIKAVEISRERTD